MTTERAIDVPETPERVLSQSVARTYLTRDAVHGPCLALVLGLTMIVVGPLTGAVLKHATQNAIRQRQTIDDATGCFRTEIAEQRCAMRSEIEITFFSVENADAVVLGSEAPRLTEVGPYPFIAEDVHASVSYPDAASVAFEQRPLRLTTDCESCDWEREIEILDADGVRVASAETLGRQLLERSPADVVLSTGATDIDAVYDVETFRGVEVAGGANYDGRLLGDAFSAERDVTLFDSWLENTATLTPRFNTKLRGIRATSYALDVTDACRMTATGCLSWTVAESNVTYSLPLLHSGNGSTLASSLVHDEARHGWTLDVDRAFGFTLARTAVYQANHWVNIYPGEPYWVASHWMRISTVAADSEVDFIKRRLRRDCLAFYICELAVSLCGALIAVVASGRLCVTPAAQKRLATIRVLARSRARDARLNRGQFKSLGTFLQSQMRRKGTSPSTDSAASSAFKSPSASQKSSKEFDDVRSLPPTDRTV